MDLKKTTVNSLRNSCKLIKADLEALPEEAFHESFGGKTRTVADIVYEIILVNDHVGMVMREEKPFHWPEGAWIKAPADFPTTKQGIIDAFDGSAQRIVETAENFSLERFVEPLITDEGETTRFERCRFMTLHMWYHSGQLNFIQTLRGDDGWHWQ